MVDREQAKGTAGWRCPVTPQARYFFAFAVASLSHAVLPPTHFFSRSSSAPDFSQSPTVSDMNLPQGPFRSSILTARPQGTGCHSFSWTISKSPHFASCAYFQTRTTSS